jgi:hypothetical protein
VLRLLRARTRLSNVNFKHMTMIDHLPLDVLYEVCAIIVGHEPTFSPGPFPQIPLWLPASDLLRLSRTKRPIRKALLSRSAQHVWRSAMDELAPPQCPDDLAVPAYLSLMVERICSVSQIVTSQR